MKVELYHRQECPFSAKVRNFIEQKGLKPSVEYHDIDEDDASYEKLMEMTQDEQVPCLVHDGEPLLESDVIVEWLERHEKELH